MERDEVLARLDEEVRIRPAAVGQVAFLELTPPLAGAWPLVPGTLLVIWSADSTALDDFQSLARQRHGTELAAALNQAPTVLEDKIDPTGDIFDHVDAIGELAYDGRPILTGATTPPWTSPSIDRVSLAFAGGTLDEGRFSTRSFVLPGSRPLSFLVLANQAEQGPEELRILRALDKQQVGLGVEPANTLVVGAVAAAVATAVADHYTDKATDRVDRQVKDWAERRQREQQRDRREAREMFKNRQAAERIRHRNASMIPEGARVAHADAVQPPTNLRDLLEARREMLGLVVRKEFPESD